MKQYDIDRDGIVTSQDIDNADHISEIVLREEKAATQKRMAWVAFALMAVFTAVLFSPIVTDARVQALADLLGLFYIAQAGIVGAYMGVTAWMSNTASRSSSYGYGGPIAPKPADPKDTSRFRAPDPDDVPPPKGR